MSDKRPASDSTSTTFFAIPPKKIACGFYHSAAISNVNADPNKEEQALGEGRGHCHEFATSDEHKAYCWGSNRFNTLGFTWEQRKRLHEEKQRSALAMPMKTNVGKGARPSSAEGVRGAQARQSHQTPAQRGELALVLSPLGADHENSAGESGGKRQSVLQSWKDKDQSYIDDILEPTYLELDRGKVYEVGCGVSHTIFLTHNPTGNPGGTVYASGLGTRGRLGVANPDATGPPDYQAEESWFAKKAMRVKFDLPRTTRILRIACGADHTLCYATNGRLYSFGADLWGQCGVGNFNATVGNVYKPTEVLIPQGETIVHFTAGAQHSLAVLGKNRELWAWGCGRNGRLGLGDTESHCFPEFVVGSSELHLAVVAAGEAHSGAIDVEGRVLTWGAGSCGRLGLDDNDDMLSPARIVFFDNIGGGVRIKVESIALGGFHTLFSQEYTRGCQIYACGTGVATGLGLGEKTCVGNLVPILPAKSPLSSFKVMQIAAGMYHSLVLFENGTIASWGVGAGGRLGNNTEKNTEFVQALQFIGFSLRGGAALMSKVELEEQAKQADVGNERSQYELAKLVCGSAQTMALTHGGHLYAWGCNDSGQLGLGGSVHFAWSPDLLVIPNRTIRDIAAGYEHCLATTTMMELWSWGKGTDGQLGLGHAHNIFQPQKLATLAEVVAIAAGEVHSAAIVQVHSGDEGAAQELFTWGSAEGGMLGAGMEYTSGINTEPRRVTFQRDFAKSRDKHAKSSTVISPMAVRCGQSHTAVILGALDKSGSVNELWTFGNGTYGKLGLGTSDNAYIPQRVDLQGNGCNAVADVACGSYHTVMLSQDGTVFTCGRSNMVCSSEDVDHPIKFTHIEGNPPAKAIACGEMHTLVVTKECKLYSWGDNRCGQVGLGASLPTVLNPDHVRLSEPAELIAAGCSHSVVALVNQQVWAFGNQSLGRLGLLRRAQDKYVWEPSQVESPWTTMESMNRIAATGPTKEDKAPEEGSAADGTSATEVQGGADAQEAGKETKDKVGALVANVTSLSAVQSLIQNQSSQCKRANLAKLEAELEKCFVGFLENLQQLRETEKGLDKIEMEIEQSVCNNLHWFKVADPVMDTATEDPELIARLPIYEKILWLLQNQTSYLGVLSCCITDPVEVEVYQRFVERLFASPSERTRHLFQMLTRLALTEEITSGRKFRDLLNPKAGSLSFNVFSSQVLSEARARDVVHLYMKFDKKVDPRSTEYKTLIHSIIEATEHNMSTFALSYEEYKDSLSEEEKKHKDESELKAAFNFALDGFYNYITESFPNTVAHVNLPPDIRQLFNHVLQELQMHKIFGESALPAELRMYEPLLRLFCQGIIIPLLRDPLRYASKEYFLKSAGNDLNPLVVANMGSVASFLEFMLEGQLGQCPKIMQSAEKVVLPLLLKYLSKQAGVQDDLHTRLLMDTYITHFSLEEELVTLAAGDLMRMSNMLSAQMMKLRIKEDDELEALCKQLPEWSDDKILLATSFEVLHNFRLDPRFILKEFDPPRVCPNSKCMLPSRYCAGVASSSIIPRFKEGDSEDPARKLEALLGQLELTQSRSLSELRDEFWKLKQVVEQSSTPSYSLVQDLKEGVRVLDMLLAENVRTQDIIDAIANSLVERERHLQYLLDLKNGLAAIQQQRDLHLKNIDGWHIELQGALRASLELKLPAKFSNKAGTTRLKFDAIHTMMKLTQTYSAAEMKELGAELRPTATYSVKQLKMKKVIVEIHPQFAAMEKHMQVTLRPAQDGGVDLALQIIQGKAQNTVATLAIPSAKLEEFRRATKTETAPLCNPGEPAFLTCMCVDFAAMVARLKTQ